MLPGALLQGQFIFIPTQWFSIWRLLVLGIFMQAISWWMIATSMVKIPAHRTALILLLQPAMAMVWGILFFKEALTLLQAIGLMITLVSIYIGSFRSISH
jgi:drug/metabolite transporter (DMT)-like permease